MIAMTLLALGNLTATMSLWVGVTGGIGILALSLFRSIEWQESLFTSGPPSTRAEHWSAVASLKGNYANRWAMYEDLTAWVSARDWSGKMIGEIGSSNGALRSFMEGANYTELPFPQYDVQNLHELAEDHFDLIILDQTLEHVEAPDAALNEIRRVLKPGAFTIITTPFLIPVHEGASYRDYWRWTPQGMKTLLERFGFDAEVRMWGNLVAAKALLDEMYLTAEKALELGLSLSQSGSDGNFPITVWAIAKNLKPGRGSISSEPSGVCG
jgi:ubiquinone/menaquinone biosynthesis C-methylase UbiE